MVDKSKASLNVIEKKDIAEQVSDPYALPTINTRKQVAKSKLFAIEEIALTFSNGAQRVYERMQGVGRGAVMIVPFKDENTLLLIKEFCAGTHTYELGFPKGLIDPGEQAVEAANRELKEEIGFGSNNISLIRQVAMAPTFFSGTMDIFIADDLYLEKLEGDEPEPLEVVEWSVENYQALLAHPQFNEARSIAALMMALDLKR